MKDDSVWGMKGKNHRPHQKTSKNYNNKKGTSAKKQRNQTKLLPKNL